MPINTTELTSTLIRMRDIFIDDPTYAVRSKKFITEFQNYCAYELRSRKLDAKGSQIKLEHSITVGRGPVEADVAIVDAKGQPILIVDVRSQMTSVGKNFNNYIRMKAGEVESIHAKYPRCIVGLVYIHPAGDLHTRKPVGRVGSFNYVKAAAQLASLGGRTSLIDFASTYEQVAYCVIDFNAEPPKLLSTVPTQKELQLENFFDKIRDTLRSR